MLKLCSKQDVKAQEYILELKQQLIKTFLVPRLHILTLSKLG